MYLPQEVHQLYVRTVTLLGEPKPTRPVLVLEPEPTVTILGTYTIPPDSLPTAAGTVNAANSSSSKSTSKTPIIVGATIGGVVALALVAFLAWFFFRRWRGRRLYSASRGTTPILGDYGREKSGIGETPETGPLRNSGGIFSPFKGYHQAPHDGEPLDGPRDSMEIEEGGTVDRPVPNEEKRALVPPPDNEHPAYHPLPGKNLPAYVPGPAYNSLPSQRPVAPPRSMSLVPDVSPKIPGLVFTPIEIMLGDTQLDTIPITPQAELAASPVQPKPSSPIPSSKFSTARTSLTPSSPRKSLSSMHPAPLAKVTISRRPCENSPLTNFSMKHISVLRPGFPSPTAGGKIELPASSPPVDTSVANDVPVKASPNPTPAFHHIYMPEALSGISMSSADTAYSTVPIGLGDRTPDIKTRALSSRDDWVQPKPSNLRQEHKPSPQMKQEKRSQPERKLSEQYSRELGSPPQPGQGRRRTPPARREPLASPPPKLERENTPPLPSNDHLSLSDTHPALRDHVRQERVETPTPKQGKRSMRKPPPPLRQQRSDVSAISDFTLREQTSEQSMLTVSEESEIAPAPTKSKHRKKWSASERDHMSLLVYKGDAPLGNNEATPLFSAEQLSEESDMSIQPLVLQSRQGWSPVPLTPMTLLNKTKAQKHADGMF